MENTLGLALGITVIGMTLLFLALSFFYGLLSLMTKIFKGRAPVATGDETDSGTVSPESEAMLLAAAVVVAMARAELEQGGHAGVAIFDEHDGAERISPWWALHHQRELNLGPTAWRIQ